MIATLTVDPDLKGDQTSFPERASRCQGGCSFGQVLQQATKRINQAFAALFRFHRLTHAQWSVLTALRETPFITAAHIARTHHFDAGALSRGVEDLVHRGLIDRRQSQSDRRILHLSLTRAGDLLWEGLLPDVNSTWDDILKGLDPSEVRVLTHSLGRLTS